MSISASKIDNPHELATPDFLNLANSQALASYTAQPTLIVEQARQEIAAAEGAYGRRQLYELIQNSVDALKGTQEGRIHVLLTESALYCANSGRALTVGDLRAILQAFLSQKIGDEIGRYGLGFKSVLGVTDSPEFFSELVSFRFDPNWSAELICEHTGYVGITPRLRLARPIEIKDARVRDETLDLLFEWASAVFKLPFRDSHHAWLNYDLRNFPAEFLLFCPHVKELCLEDISNQAETEVRVVKREGTDPIKVLVNGRGSEWYLFSQTVKPSDEAIVDGGHFAGREKLELTWAVPTRGGPSDGHFWAYFPVAKERMSLKGIMNAAWKLNDDRQNILEGKFNDELLREAARLALKNIPRLLDPGDPGKILEVLPARLDERAGADLTLTKFFYDEAQNKETIPDTAGTLRKAADLKLHPKAIPDEALNSWGKCPYQPQDWAHISTVVNTTRSARIDQLLTPGQARQSITVWLEALVDSANIDKAVRLGGLSRTEAHALCSAHALYAAAAIYESGTPQVRTEVTQAAILLTVNETLVAPHKEKVFLPAHENLNYPGVEIVHRLVLEQRGVREALEKLGISSVDASSELQALLASSEPQNLEDDDWDKIWKVIAVIEENPETTGRSAAILREYCRDEDARALISLRTRSGHFRTIRETLLPPQIVPADGECDAETAVDLEYHRNQEGLIKELGGVESPLAEGGSKTEKWFNSYRFEAISKYTRYLADLDFKGQPSLNRLNFQQESFPGPLESLPNLSEESCARFTSHLLLLSQNEKPWVLAHSTRREYPSLEVESPGLWMIRQYGKLTTSKGIVSVNQSVGPKFDRWSSFLPVANIDAQSAVLLDLPSEPTQLTRTQWSQALEVAAQQADDLEVGRFYRYFCSAQKPPERLMCWNRQTREMCRTDRVTVVVRNALVESSLQASNVPYIVVEDSETATELTKHWGLGAADAVVSVEPRFVASGPEVPVGDAFVGLSVRLTNEQSDLRLVPCSSLRREIISAAGTHSEEQKYIFGGNRLYYADTLSPGEVLDEVSKNLGIELTSYERDDVLFSRESEDARTRLAEIRHITEIPDKLLACVGAEPLRRRLSEPLLEAARERYSELTDEVIAKVYVAVYGVESLILLKDDLSRGGIAVPSQWTGTYTARKFVKELGFPTEFAGFRGSDRQPAIDIEGRPFLPPLHDFQENAVSNIRNLLLARRSKRRGLLSLPTGAGKTRVAVEAIVRAIDEGGLVGPILWVAQSDELCEQAVQTWSEVWRAVGPRRSLRINRLWAHNEADEWVEGPQAVIATMQKLQGVINDPSYDWLKVCSALVVDEAHTSITKGYTSILEWIGSTVRRKIDRCPVLGLTATPFRGGAIETSRLAIRYGNNRLDESLFTEDPYRALQKMGVLSAVKHELLDGVDVLLNETELLELKRNRLLPASAGDRLGANRVRNRNLLASIKALPGDWPVLLFAISVEHARTIAALLNADGVSAAAISAETAPGARRHYVERFRQGEIRVLTNYGVLTTGFDAPAVRAIYVARPTFSPGLYQQMIGRGLRGPLNQGKAECLIVNVKDNFEQFGEELAFSEFEYLWKD